ncbi:MAG: hypothetical protein WBF53_07050 [Litorimonas sp.]
MSKVFAGLAKVNGIAASVLQFIPGGQPFAALAAASASIYGGLAQLTAKPPRPPAQVEDILLGGDQPMPFAVGRCFIPGNLVHAEAHGREREDVPNPWRTDTIVLTGAGPVVSIDALYANKSVVSFGQDGWENGYYGKYMRGDTQLGATPETTALDWTALDSGAPPSFREWSSSRRLSGFAAMQFGMLLDAEETHFRSGPPKFGAVGRWTRHYDPRLDSTYPGGSGPHRLGDESTYDYSVNGVIQALTYLYGRYQNGKLVLGGGLPVTAIDVPSFVAAANVADANNWRCNGLMFENGEDGEIWNNVKLMLQTAGAWPTNDGGVVRCLQRRPVVTLDTITKADLTGAYDLCGMKSVKDGFNTVIPTIVSESNEWSEVPIDAVGVPTLVASQGEVRSKSRSYKLVTDPSQASALATLDIYDSVELDPIQLTLSRRLIGFEVGSGFDVQLPEIGLVGTFVMLSKKIDLATGNVVVGLKSDTTEKHAFALGQTNVAPPQPTLVTNVELDRAARELLIGPLRSSSIQNSAVSDLDSPITIAEETDGSWTASVPQHKRNYANPETFPSVTVNATTVTGLSASTRYHLYYDDRWMGGGDVAMTATTNLAEAVISPANPYRHRVAVIRTAGAGETADPPQPTAPPGTDDEDGFWDGQTKFPEP